jgi:predicted RNA binding protein YcfA (HicA-like mRNA interferase family)
LPRDFSARELIRFLESRFGYQVTRQKGSHIRLTTREPLERHLTIPAHDPLKPGTLSAILSEVAEQVGMDREQLLRDLLS